MTSFFRMLTIPGLLTLAMLCSPVANRADDKTAAKPAVAKKAGTMTVERLREMLDDLGYEPETRTRTDGSVYYNVKIEREGWTFSFQAMMSPSGEYVWLVTPLVKLPESGKVNVKALENVLNLNYARSPAFFSLRNDRTLRFDQAIPAANLKAGDLRPLLDDYLVAIRQTHSAWRTVGVPVDAAATASAK